MSAKLKELRARLRNVAEYRVNESLLIAGEALDRLSLMERYLDMVSLSAVELHDGNSPTAYPECGCSHCRFIAECRERLK